MLDGLHLMWTAFKSWFNGPFSNFFMVALLIIIGDSAGFSQPTSMGEFILGFIWWSMFLYFAWHVYSKWRK